MIAKELTIGCEERVQKDMAIGVKNPEYRPQTNVTNVSSRHNKEPVGFKWVEDEGWVCLDCQDSSSKLLAGASFCADSYRFRRGGFKRFLRGEINQMCI